ncbi:MAG TPA: chemotaxis protein CheW [Oligoflexus sp.]|uniref:chemotaxis protein CheW n=1 Tax=Oligoflexus sp. TaxID=1971216 RepID=UPI002D3AF09A|nr:chemotaxis protein CheW [Oligoflexus sp.]HYX34369.1 chemotaxis protein CheW [Oligoflexus sp.]
MNEFDRQDIVTDEESASRYLVFELGGDVFAAPLLDVMEVIETKPPQTLPNTLPHFLGLINVRGKLFNVVDFRVKFAMKMPEFKEHAAYILYTSEVGNFALAVDKVRAVQTFNAEHIDTSSHILSQESQSFISGVAKLDSQLISIIKLKSLLEDEELLSYSKSALSA